MRIQDLIGETYTVTGHGRWLRTMEHDSLVIDVEEQVFWWNSRGIVGNAFDWLTEIIGLAPQEAYDVIEDKETVLLSKLKTYVDTPKSDVTPYQKLVEVFYTYGKKHRDYWYGIRGYTEETVDRFRLGYTGEWYTIPIYVDGSFTNFQCLRHEPRRRKVWYVGLGALPFNFSILAVTPWIIVAEGPVDAIMLRQNNIPAVSQTGGSGTWKNKWLRYFIDTKRIHVCYDNDVAGNEGSVRVAEKLGGSRTKIYNFWDYDEGFDVTDFFRDGGTRESFLELIFSNSIDMWNVPRV